MGRTPPGVRELKLLLDSIVRQLSVCRTPPGVRELKLEATDSAVEGVASHPSRGA